MKKLVAVVLAMILALGAVALVMASPNPTDNSEGVIRFVRNDGVWVPPTDDDDWADIPIPPGPVDPDGPRRPRPPRPPATNGPDDPGDPGHPGDPGWEGNPDIEEVVRGMDVTNLDFHTRYTTASPAFFYSWYHNADDAEWAHSTEVNWRSRQGLIVNHQMSPWLVQVAITDFIGEDSGNSVFGNGSRFELIPHTQADFIPLSSPPGAGRLTQTGTGFFNTNNVAIDAATGLAGFHAMYWTGGIDSTSSTSAERGVAQLTWTLVPN